MHGAIGIFDSGLGGLSVAKEIRTLLPQESLVYVADSAHVPYGGRTEEFIRMRSHRLTEFLLSQGVKAIVIACNTATAAAAKSLRETYPNVPIIGMEPAIKPAIAATKSGVVGVLATTGTIQSANYAALLGKVAQGGVKIVSQPAPGLVECVEAGELNTPATNGKVAAFVRPLLDKGADVIVLGCTHYPFLRPIIQQIAGPQVQLIDTGAAVARQLANRLGENQCAASLGHATMAFYTTGDTTNAQTALHKLWGTPEPVHHCPA